VTPQTRVAYILGVGRSGSTILDLAIGAASNALSAGELTWYPMLNEPSGGSGKSKAMVFCSCGSPVESCELWFKVTREMFTKGELDRFRQSTRRYERRGSVPLILFSRMVRSTRLSNHVRTLQSVVRAAAARANVMTIVDSSKLLSRGLLYLMMPESTVDVRYVHLIRDGNDHLESRITRRDPGDETPSPARSPVLIEVFATADWVLQNLLASTLGFLRRDKYLRIRYEDFVTDPASTIARIGQFLNLDVSAVIPRLSEGGRLPRGHLLGGNRLKFNPVLWKSNESRFRNRREERRFLVFRCLAGWLQRWYGYLPPDRTPRPELIPSPEQCTPPVE
jgi:hypothetical protein